MADGGGGGAGGKGGGNASVCRMWQNKMQTNKAVSAESLENTDVNLAQLAHVFVCQHCFQLRAYSIKQV